MTDVMNFFQAMFMFKNYAPVSLKTAEVKLAVALKAEALELAAVADQEMHNGSTTQELSNAAQDKEKRRIFAEIAVWHHNRAAEKYGKAAARFDEAGRVHIKKIRAFNRRAEEMHQRAEQAVAAVNQLNDFLIQN